MIFIFQIQSADHLRHLVKYRYLSVLDAINNYGIHHSDQVSSNTTLSLCIHCLAGYTFCEPGPEYIEHKWSRWKATQRHKQHFARLTNSDILSRLISLKSLVSWQVQPMISVRHVKGYKKETCNQWSHECLHSARAKTADCKSKWHFTSYILTYIIVHFSISLCWVLFCLVTGVSPKAKC